MASAHPIWTYFIRPDDKPRPGRADVAGVPLARPGRRRGAYFGSISGREEVQDALVAEQVPSDTDVDVWLAGYGYERQGDE